MIPILTLAVQGLSKQAYDIYQHCVCQCSVNSQHQVISRHNSMLILSQLTASCTWPLKWYFNSALVPYNSKHGKIYKRSSWTYYDLVTLYCLCQWTWLSLVQLILCCLFEAINRINAGKLSIGFWKNKFSEISIKILFSRKNIWNAVCKMAAILFRPHYLYANSRFS